MEAGGQHSGTPANGEVPDFDPFPSQRRFDCQG